MSEERHHVAAELLRERLSAPPEGMDARVLAALDAERVRVRRRGRRRVAAGIATALVVLVAALSGLPPVGSDDTTASVPIVLLSGDCSGPADNDPDRLVVAGTWRGREAERFAKVLERFATDTGAKITYAYETRDIPAKLKSRLKRGCPVDVALLPMPGFVEELARTGKILPLDTIAGDLVKRNYNVTWRRLGQYRGRLYGVWYKAANKSIVWYDAAAFRAAGITSTPATWPRLMEAADRLRSSGMRPFAVAGASAWSLTDWFENIYLRTAGARRYDQLAAHEIPWTHPSVVRALRRLGALFGNESLIGSRGRALQTSFEESVRDVLGANPRAAMLFEADFVRAFAPGVADASLFAFPGEVAGGPASAVVGGDVAVLFDRRKSARELIRFLASPIAAEPWAGAGGFLSPNRALPAAVYTDPLMRRAAKMLVDAPVVRFDLSDLQPPDFGATAGQGMWQIFQDFLKDPEDVTGTARRLEAAAGAARRCVRAIAERC